MGNKFKAREKVLIVEKYTHFIRAAKGIRSERAGDYQYWTAINSRYKVLPYYEGMITAKSKGPHYAVSFLDEWGESQNIVLHEDAILKYDEALLLLYVD